MKKPKILAQTPHSVIYEARPYAFKLTKSNRDLLMGCIRHRNILKLHRVFQTAELYCIVTDYCDGGDISSWIKTHGGNYKYALIWGTQLALAIACLHENKIVHRDVKTANIFLKNMHAVLGDFGVATRFEDMGREQTGTPYYMAPEAVEGELQNETVDVWSYACVIMEIKTGKRLFDKKDLFEKIKYVDVNIAGDGIIEKISRRCITKVAHRISIKDVLSLLSEWARQKKIQKLQQSLDLTATPKNSFLFDNSISTYEMIELIQLYLEQTPLHSLKVHLYKLTEIAYSLL